MCNYDIAWRIEKRLHEVYWDAVILDEAHQVKNKKSKRARAIVGYKPKRDEDPSLASSGIPARYRIALSGTPIENCVEEMWPVLWWLDRDNFPSVWTLLKLAGCRYVPGVGQTEPTAVGKSALQDMLRVKIMIRRLKKDVLPELPPKTRTLVEYSTEGLEHLIRQESEMWEEQEEERTAAQAALVVAKASDDAEGYRKAVERLKEIQGICFTEMAKIRKQTSIAKVPQTIELLKEMIEENGNAKILVFGHHKESLELLHSEFNRSVLIHGDHNQSQRDDRVHRFQTDPECGPFFGSIRATGEGLTLTAATKVLFHESDWVPSKMVQAEDRCIAEGQKILTKCGWKRIEQITVGDQVVNRFGNFATVTDCWSRGAVETMVEIELEGWNETIICTASHRILSQGEWKEAGTLRPGSIVDMPNDSSEQDEIRSLQFDEDCRVQSSYINHWGTKQNNGRRVAAPSTIELTDEALFAFGYFAGDGFASTIKGKGRFVSFSGNNGKKHDALQRCKAWAESVGMHVGTYHQKDSQGIEIRAYSAEWAMWFKKHFGEGAANKFLPEFLLKLSKRQTNVVMCGLMASDGYERRGRNEYVTMAPSLAANVAHLSMRAGHKPCITRQSDKSGNAYVVAYSNGVRKGLVVESIKFRNPKRNNGKREIVYDLTIDGDPSFVLGTVVVHNCHRIGQKDNVTVMVCVVPGTIDAKMVKVCMEKADLADKTLDAMTKTETMDTPALAEIKDWKPLATKREIENNALLVTPEQRDAVVMCLRMLAGMCDGARQLDGAGFNKLDAAIGKELASRGSLSDKQVALGARLAARYKRQLPEDVLALAIGRTANDTN